ncbi:hypothetical protein [Fulvivirga lutea]|uniref:Uncharacterized protein n=1 Tax=Fulvivirga lutea TaxID=2810512 RepID=A0A974ZZJ5_9BACT|nr:hypothetical protein [Fulvivirga lutea]QSE96294.1 hypothetical protein JR347_11815 [Fulvivirga lutea]
MHRIGLKFDKYSILTFPMAFAIIPILLIASIVVGVCTIILKVVVDVMT